MKISEKVQDIVKNYRETPVTLLSGLTRDTYAIIKRIYFYKYDKYVECSDPNAIFWQIVTHYIPHYSKMIDLDPKDLTPKGEGETNFYQAWVLRRLLAQWIEKENFGVDIDDLTKSVASFGSFVWKIVPGKEKKVEPCDLRNLAFDASLPTLRGKDKVELHYLSEQDIKEKKGIWNNTEELWKNAESADPNKPNEKGKKEFWEFSGWFEDKFQHVIGAGKGDREVIAFEEVIEPEDDLYYDFHLNEFDGCWLRKGAYETCFPEQEQANAVVNQNASAREIASLLLLRSSDPNTQGNVLQQAINGQIISSSDLQQIAIDNRAFTVLLNELDRIERQVQKKLMLPDIATGDALPSGTPFRGMAIMSNAYKSAFKQIRNRIATPLVDIMFEQIMPDLIKKWNRGTMVEIAQDEADIKMYDQALIMATKLDFYAQANESQYAVTGEDLGQIEEEVGRSVKANGRKVEVPKGFFNFKYGISLDPVGETFDKASQNDSIIQALTLQMQNPAITESPAFQMLLENNGITPYKLSKTEQQQQVQTVQPPVQMPQMPEGSLMGQADTANI